MHFSDCVTFANQMHDLWLVVEQGFLDMRLDN